MFVPAAFITGISGQFYRQFALTIAGATVISLIVSLTLSPALCALLAAAAWPGRARAHGGCGRVHVSFGLFNRAFEGLAHAYGRLTARLVRVAVLMLAVYAGSSPTASTSFARRRSGSSRSSTPAT